MRRKLERNASAALEKMGYTSRSWTAYKEGWLFGFVQKADVVYGCLAFTCPGMITIEILKSHDCKCFAV